MGTGVTLLASLAPARAATRVSPLAALAPVTVSVHERSGRVRAVFSVLMVVGGAGALGLGLLVSSRSSMPMGLAIGILGGAVSFIGVLLGSVYWVPALLGRLGPLLGRGPAARLAAANAVRNPRRVATTSGALFIGVTLVAMMATGAASATKAFSDGLAEQMPVDVVVSAVPGSDARAACRPGSPTRCAASPTSPTSPGSPRPASSSRCPAARPRPRSSGPTRPSCARRCSSRSSPRRSPTRPW